jgi:hypothetical protein
MPTRDTSSCVNNSHLCKTLWFLWIILLFIFIHKSARIDFLDWRSLIDLNYTIQARPVSMSCYKARLFCTEKFILIWLGGMHLQHLFHKFQQILPINPIQCVLPQVFKFYLACFVKYINGWYVLGCFGSVPFEPENIQFC